MLDYVFREYDIRGKVGSEFNLDEVYNLTQAIIYYLREKNPSLKHVLVGADGRTHSPAIKEALCSSLQDAGCDVTFIGICPTPVVYFGMHTLPVDVGLMITASHNGPAYNGIKICLGKESVWGSQIQDIKRAFTQKKSVVSLQKGSYGEIQLINDYIAWLKNHFSSLIGYDIPFVMDCGNGAAGSVIPQLIQEMKFSNATILYPEIDGTYPNHEADPTVPENMYSVRSLLEKEPYVLGIGFDGDCDRMAAMTKQGELVQGDKLLALFSKEIAEHNPGMAVVFDIKCSEQLQKLLRNWGARPYMVPSGHSIIKNNMKKEDALLAGELSCHFFFKDRYFGYDDGIYAALRLLELLQKQKRSFEELLSIFPKVHSTLEIRIECHEETKRSIVENATKQLRERENISVLTIDGIRVTMADGWGLLRASNTQPVICLRFEAETTAGLKTIQNEFIDLLKPYLDETLLRTHIKVTS